MSHIGDLLFVDDDRDLREAVSDLLNDAFTCACTGLGGYEELVALGRRALDCDMAFLDINLGPGVPSGLDAYAWLREHDFGGRIVFLTGHADSHPLVVEASRIGDAQVITKPISMDVFEGLLDSVPARQADRER
ncbi:MAG TPA: response regulator [Polyangia bacterium]|nr:response regulator [Polyangia bacterium]